MTFNVKLNYNLQQEHLKNNVYSKIRVPLSKIIDYTDLSKLYANVVNYKVQHSILIENPESVKLQVKDATTTLIDYVDYKAINESFTKVYLNFDLMVGNDGRIALFSSDNGFDECLIFVVNTSASNQDFGIIENSNGTDRWIFTESVDLSSDTYYNFEIVLDLSKKSLCVYRNSYYITLLNYNANISGTDLIIKLHIFPDNVNNYTQIRNFIIAYE